MKLPTEITLLIEPKKIEKYLLDLTSKDGKSKAEFFLSNGIEIDKPNVLEEFLLTQAKSQSTKSATPTPFGIKYIFESEMVFPNGKAHLIRSVWTDDNLKNRIRFVTAYKINE